MTNYEKLQQLLNDENLQKTLADHLLCSKVKLNLHEEDNRRYLLNLHVIESIGDEDVLIYIESFAIQLNDRNSLLFFGIILDEVVSPRQALEIAKTGQIIEDHLNAFL